MWNFANILRNLITKHEGIYYLTLSWLRLIVNHVNYAQEMYFFLGFF